MLKYKKESYSMKELLQYIQIKEQARKSDQLEEKENNEKVQIVESKMPMSENQPQKKLEKKKNKWLHKSRNNFKGKKDPYFVCGKLGHVARDCHHKKGQQSEKIQQSTILMILIIMLLSSQLLWLVARLKHYLSCNSPKKCLYHLHGYGE